ncbi:sigma factor regulator [Cytobacillus oceanisediminis]|uniref:Sigma factor regulator n=1 Tax=Cytobacillus oceanisediminis TaxID=665099 RepID=A0A2V2ZFQ5_9BACI|nr:anti sigma factor C-terminal domain-containing protein [Cytobacillus oceanisediminis]PWW17060.1 sigma factor regulator [Cytobacillus oceanisediminis]
MNDKKNSKQTSEIDFLSDSLFQRSIKKARWKQFGLYTLISIVTVIGCIVIIHLGTQYLITKKIQEDNLQHQANVRGGEPVKGAGYTNRSTRYHYNIFSAVGETIYYKRIGNRQFVWDTETKKYPAIGKVEVIDRGSGVTEINQMDKEAKRVVRYNQLNNERIIDFYYSNINYTFLPQELEIAAGLDENKLIEVAISFYEPMTLSDLGEVLGYKNVDWLWVNTKTKKQMEKIEGMQGSDSVKVVNGDNAYGFGVSEEYPYSDFQMQNTLISGAVISGTPKELERFLNLNIIRSSVIGATIDKY